MAKKAPDEYHYLKLNELKVGQTQVNFYGVLHLVEKELKVTASGKYHTMIRLVDETLNGGKSFLVHIFSETGNIPAMENGCIIRMHRVKIEKYNDNIDGRIFKSFDFVVFPRILKPGSLFKTTATSIQYTPHDKARIMELRKWISSWWVDSNELELTQGGTYRMPECRVIVNQEVTSKNPAPPAAEKQTPGCSSSKDCGTRIDFGGDTVKRKKNENEPSDEEKSHKRRGGTRMLPNPAACTGNTVLNPAYLASTFRIQKESSETPEVSGRFPCKMSSKASSGSSYTNGHNDFSPTSSEASTSSFPKTSIPMRTSPRRGPSLEKSNGNSQLRLNKLQDEKPSEATSTSTSKHSRSAGSKSLEATLNTPSSTCDSFPKAPLTVSSVASERQNAQRNEVSNESAETGLVSKKQDTSQSTDSLQNFPRTAFGLRRCFYVSSLKESDRDRAKKDSGQHSPERGSDHKISSVKSPRSLAINGTTEPAIKDCSVVVSMLDVKDYPSITTSSKEDFKTKNKKLRAPKEKKVDTSVTEICESDLEDGEDEGPWKSSSADYQLSSENMDCCKSSPILLDDDDPRLRGFDNAVLKDIALIEIAESSPEESLYLPFTDVTSSVHTSLTELKQASWPTRRVNVMVLNMKPSLEVLRNKTKDLVSGHCKQCGRFFPYSKLLWREIKRNDQKNVKEAVCPSCSRYFKSSPSEPACPSCDSSSVSLHFRMKLFVKDLWGTNLSVMATRNDASVFLGVDVRQYLLRSECQQEVFDTLSKVVGVKGTFNLNVRKVFTQVGSQYHLYGTSLEEIV